MNERVSEQWIDFFVLSLGEPMSSATRKRSQACRSLAGTNRDCLVLPGLRLDPSSVPDSYSPLRTWDSWIDLAISPSVRPPALVERVARVCRAGAVFEISGFASHMQRFFSRAPRYGGICSTQFQNLRPILMESLIPAKSKRMPMVFGRSEKSSTASRSTWSREIEAGVPSCLGTSSVVVWPAGSVVAAASHPFLGVQ